MPMSEVWCYIVGGKKPFLVNIDPATKVDGLITQIKTQNASLKDIENTEITLYQVEVREDERQRRIIELQRLAQNLNQYKPLDETKPVSKYFSEEVQNKNYFVIVEVSKGEFIDSFRVLACGHGDVALFLCSPADVFPYIVYALYSPTMTTLATH